MSVWYILGAILLGIIIGYFISNMMNKQSEKDTPTGTPTATRSALSDSIAKMIYSSVDTTKENFDSASPEKDIEKISTLISKGNLKEIENLIKNQTALENVTKTINSTSEILKPELVSDSEIKEVVDILSLEGEKEQINKEIDIISLSLDIMDNNPLVTQQEKEKSEKILTELIEKQIKIQEKLDKKLPLETALLNIKDIEKLAHLQEIQAKILTKIEKKKKKMEEKIKSNTKIKKELETKIELEKNKELQEKKTKIKENIGKRSY